MCLLKRLHTDTATKHLLQPFTGQSVDLVVFIAKLIWLMGFGISMEPGNYKSYLLGIIAHYI